MKKCLTLVVITICLVACSGENEVLDMDYLCSEQGSMKPVCGFQSPEDMEWLPDHTGMVVSEYGFIGKKEGSLKLFEPASNKVSTLYDSKTPRTNTEHKDWGDARCTEQQYFSPHGISLSQRSDGRWQLLVVNHAEIETIEFFELEQVERQWKLQWRGCVAAPDDSLFNDVTAAGEGFYATRFFQKGSVMNSLWDYYLKRKNGHVKHWSAEKSWSVLDGTQSVLPNGILWNPALKELAVSEWGNKQLNVYSLDGKKKYSVEMPFPDNVSWNADRTAYLVPSKEGSFMKTASCSSNEVELCKGAFTVYEIDPATGAESVRYKNAGEFYGAASNAVEKDGVLYIGSFLGSRLLVVEDISQ